MTSVRSVARLILAIFLPAIVFASGAMSARAQQDVQTVAPGESKIILETANDVSNATAIHGMVASGTREKGGAKTTILVYVPDPDPGVVSDTVTYTVDGTETKIPIAIERASPLLTSDAFYSASFKAIFALFILAVLIESGLALILRWRPFVSYFDSRTVNAVVAFVVSYVFVDYFNLDIASELISIYSGTPYEATTAGTVLTALIVAGGSAGVNRIFRSLGFRPPSAAEQEQPKPAYTDAWFAVTLVREKARGPVNVLIGPPGAAAVAGTITGTSWKGAWWRFFLRDKGRFPRSGGYAMPAANGPYEVVLQGIDGNKNLVASATWGPHPVSGGGIIDIELTV